MVLDVAGNSLKVRPSEKTKIMAVGLPCVVTRKLRGRAERRRGPWDLPSLASQSQRPRVRDFFMTKILKQ